LENFIWSTQYETQWFNLPNSSHIGILVYAYINLFDFFPWDQSIFTHILRELVSFFSPFMNSMFLSKSRNQNFSHSPWITDFIIGHWNLVLISPVQWCWNGTSILMNSSWVLSNSLAFPLLSLHISKEESVFGGRNPSIPFPHP